jgi:hypothetical protein
MPQHAFSNLVILLILYITHTTHTHTHTSAPEYIRIHTHKQQTRGNAGGDIDDMLNSRETAQISKVPYIVTFI